MAAAATHLWRVAQPLQGGNDSDLASFLMADSPRVTAAVAPALVTSALPLGMDPTGMRPKGMSIDFNSTYNMLAVTDENTDETQVSKLSTLSASPAAIDTAIGPVLDSASIMESTLHVKGQPSATDGVLYSPLIVLEDYDGDGGSAESSSPGRRPSSTTATVATTVLPTASGRHERMRTDEFGGFVGFDGVNGELMTDGRQVSDGERIEMLAKANETLRKQSEINAQILAEKEKIILYLVYRLSCYELPDTVKDQARVDALEKATLAGFSTDQHSFIVDILADNMRLEHALSEMLHEWENPEAKRTETDDKMQSSAADTGDAAALTDLALAVAGDECKEQTTDSGIIILKKKKVSDSTAKSESEAKKVRKPSTHEIGIGTDDDWGYKFDISDFTDSSDKKDAGDDTLEKTESATATVATSVCLEPKLREAITVDLDMGQPVSGSADRKRSDSVNWTSFLSWQSGRKEDRRGSSMASLGLSGLIEAMKDDQNAWGKRDTLTNWAELPITEEWTTGNLLDPSPDWDFDWEDSKPEAAASFEEEAKEAAPGTRKRMSVDRSERKSDSRVQKLESEISRIVQSKMELVLSTASEFDRLRTYIAKIIAAASAVGLDLSGIDDDLAAK